MNLINTIEALAKLNISNMSDYEKIEQFENFACDLNVTGNRLIEIMKNEISAIKSLDCYGQKTYETAIYRATLECALFNARRCYHTRLAIAV